MRIFKRSLAWMLALCMMLSISGPVLAAGELSSADRLKTTDATVILDGTGSKEVTVEIEGIDEMIVYAVEGYWDLADSTGNLTLTGMGSDSLEFDDVYNYVEPSEGYVIWTDDLFKGLCPMENGKNLLTATYLVDKDTPEGEYTVTFSMDVLTAKRPEDAKQKTTAGHTYTATITVEGHSHVPASSVEENRVEADCENAGSYDEVIYCADPECGEELSRNTVEIPALGHRVIMHKGQVIDPLVFENDEDNPFNLDGEYYNSTNFNEHHSFSEVRIKAVYPCTLKLTYGVSCEEFYDYFYILHNGVELDRISGEVNGKEMTVPMKVGDVVAIGYSKDMSNSEGEDCGWFTPAYDKVTLTEAWEVPAESLAPDCLHPVVCNYCGAEVYGALEHAWGDVFYAWEEDGSACTATLVCERDEAHNVTVHADISSEVTKEPTFTEMGETTYTAIFAEDWAETQTLTLEDIDILPLTREAAAQFIVDMLGLKYSSTMTIPYPDVAKDSPYYKAICILYDKGWLLGKNEDTFVPDGTFTRAEFAALLWRLDLLDGMPEEVPTDVKAGYWHYQYVCTVMSHGIMGVYEDGLFHPGDLLYLPDVDAVTLKAVLDSITPAVSLDLASGSITIDQTENGISIFTQNGTKSYTRSGTGIIRQSNNTTPTANFIMVQSGTVNLTISGINTSAPIDVKKGAALTLNLVRENTVSASVRVPSGAELTIKGSGVLTATGGVGAAGIGGGHYGDGGKITISGGTVTASGSGGGAGIGGGDHGDGGEITITGGTVTANGIGGGAYGDGGEITISDGTVTAAGGSGAGIGGGNWGDGGEITITGGIVTATGSYAAGIGGSDGNITISGGTVTATGGDDAAGIRGGEITISGGTVTATGGSGATGIGGSGGNVTISNAEVTAKGYYNAIGGGYNDNKYGCDSVVIEDSATVDLSYRYNGGSAVQEKITIHTQPLDSAALSGNGALFTADAYGASGLTYQWQVSADNKTWADVEGVNASEDYIPMSAENDGYYYRCKLTNGWGNTIYTASAQAYILAFAKQPTSVDAELDDLVAFEVTPSCNNVTYQWQRSYDDGLSWQDVEGEIYSILMVQTAPDDANAKYRCIITATNGDQLASDAVEINLDLGETVIYAIDVYQQTPDGAGYDLISHEVFESEIGEEVSAPAQSFDGFYENTVLSVPSGVVTGDGALVLARYFDRETYVIDFMTNGGTAVAPIEALYGASVEKPDAPVRYGYTFGGWYADEDLTEAYTFNTMPLGGATVYAKWEVTGADRGMEYTINRMGMYDIDTHEEYKAIPKAKFLLEAEVTNLCSTSIDAILLVHYSADGQMLGMSYLYGNPEIGKTSVFGTLIDNTDGNIGCIKAFVVPTVGSMIPLAESMEIGEMEEPVEGYTMAVMVAGDTATIVVEGEMEAEDHIAVMMWKDGKYSNVGLASWEGYVDGKHTYTFRNNMTSDYEFAFKLVVDGEVLITETIVVPR